MTFKIGIVGLGYVGLPLAIEFAKKYAVVGFDIDKTRVHELNSGKDHTSEANLYSMKNAMKTSGDCGLIFSTDGDDLKSCNFFILTVPTPIDRFKKPDLTPLLKASTLVGGLLKKGDIVVYESTVYPGCTEEDCVPVLEKNSGLIFNRDFFCGYSPERINPGDKINTLTKIVKVTSGSNPEIAEKIDKLYKSIISAGTYLAPSIKVAEASKSIENAQRDVNISFINELALIFERMGIDTNEVLTAAGTKWNFLTYKPGLVGGHCIGVDPYYLTYKAESLGYHPQVILSGRRVNDNMGFFIANKVVKLMIQKGLSIKGSKALILGVTFKENCPDIRNSKVIDIHNELRQFGINVDVYDPNANREEVSSVYDINLISIPNSYDAVIIAVAHDEFLKMSIDDLKKSQESVVYDVKASLDKGKTDGRL
jgi:UDP-N-acetyl-D-glucosamine/UDP-N-acetyl-D-galactosamine dehydrogenase